MMKKAVYILVALFLLSVVGNAGTGEVKGGKKQAPTTIVKKKDKKQEDTKKTSPGKSDSSKKAQPQKKKYDDFQDKNGNGIDDRKENLKRKKTEGSDTKTKKKDPQP